MITGNSPRGHTSLNPATEGTPAKGLSAGQKAGVGVMGTLSASSIVVGALAVVGFGALTAVTFGVPLIVAGVVGLAASLYGAKKLANRNVAQVETKAQEMVKPGGPSQTYTDALSKVKENIAFVASQKGSKVGTDICRASEISKFVAHACGAPFTRLIETLNTPNANVPEALKSAANDIPDEVCKLFAECEKQIDSELGTHGRTDERATFMKGLRANGIGHSIAPVLGEMLKKLQERHEPVANQMKLGMVQQAIVAGVNNDSEASPWRNFLEDILVKGRTLIGSEDRPADGISRTDFKGDSSAVRDRSADSPTAFHSAPTDNMSASHFSSSVAAHVTPRSETPENDSKDSKSVTTIYAPLTKAPAAFFTSNNLYGDTFERLSTGLKIEVRAAMTNEVCRNAQAYGLLKSSISVLLDGLNPIGATGEARCPTAKEIVDALEGADIEKIPVESRKFLASVAARMDEEIVAAGRTVQRESYHQALHVNLLGHSGLHAYILEKFSTIDRAAVGPTVSALAKGGVGGAPNAAATNQGGQLSEVDKGKLQNFYARAFDSGRQILEAEARASMDGTTF